MTVTNAAGCTATATQTVTVNPLPVVAISGNTTICAGNNAVLTASGGTAYSWNSGENTATITVSPSSTTPYMVTVTDANNCQKTGTATVTVNALPVAAISGNITLCAGSSTTLTATGGASYSWNSGQNTATITVSPSITTPYTVTVTDGNNCQNTETATVTVNAPAPVITQNGPALSTGTFVAYQWLLAGQPISGATSQSFTATQNGTYTVTVVDANGCNAVSAPVTVTNVAVDATLLADVRISPNPTTGILTISSDQPLHGSLYTLTGEKVMTVESANALDLSALADGVYLLHLRAQDGSEARVRVVKMQ